MSDDKLEELENLVSSSPARKPTPSPDAKRTKKPVKGGRTWKELVVDKSNDKSADPDEDKIRTTATARKPTIPGKAKSKSVSKDIDDVDTNRELHEPKPTTEKTPAKSGRGVAKVIKRGKASPKAKLASAKPSPKKTAPEDDKAGESDTAEIVKGATILQMTTKIGKIAELSFEVAEMWEGFLVRHMPKDENSSTKVREAIDGILGKRKAEEDVDEDGEGEGGRERTGGRKKVKRQESV